MNAKQTLALVGCAAALALPVRAYVSPDGYRITPPGGWTADLTETATHHVYFDSPSTAEMGISVSKLGPGETAAGDAVQLISFVKHMSRNFRLVSRTSGTAAGLPTREFIADYTPLKGNIPLRIRQVLMVHAGRLYAISITESQRKYNNIAPLFARSLHSLRWTRS
jgi:hypothetical protein